MFKLRHVRYKDILAIDQLDICSGGVTCIIGKSGSGKTTLLKLLNHLISCDAGEIEAFHKPISEWDPIVLRRKVVMLSQTPAMFTGTVKDNLLIGRKFSERPPLSDIQLADALKRVHLDIDLDADSSTLSGGEQQRVALARVLLLKPEVLLLDEPSSALDENTTQFVMREIVQYVISEQKTLIMVTHSMSVVQDFANHIIEINDGKVVKVRDSHVQSF